MDTARETWLIIGLGNPGPRYANNRHNVGAMVARKLASRMGATLTPHKVQAYAAQARLGTPGSAQGPSVVIAVPSCYMNESGGAVRGLAKYYSIPPARAVVIHDELDVPAGEVRLKLGGGEGGHNGLRSVSAALGSRDYYRVRVGIGRPPGPVDPADFVLRDFSPAERKDLPLLVSDAADAVEALLEDGLLVAQQRFHGPR